MSGHADESVGEQQQERLIEAHLSSPRAQSNIQMGSFLRTEEGFPHDAGQKWGVARSSRQGGDI